MSNELKFVKTADGKGSRKIGILYWGSDSYRIVTGGYGKGAFACRVLIQRDSGRSG